MTNREKAEKIVYNLNDRRGINIDFDDEIMEEIYQEIEDVISDNKSTKNSIQDIMTTLAKHNIDTSLDINPTKNILCLDLKTDAKSHLYLYEDGTLNGRYDYEITIDMNDDMDNIIKQLCHEFVNALCGRDYGQEAWFVLCNKLNIKIV